MHRTMILIAGTFALLAALGCQSAGPNTHAGTAFGGLTGAAIGAIAGADQGKSLEGAAIGATAGGLLGGAMGNAIDQDIAREDAARQASYIEAASHAATIDSVTQMTASGLSDQVIAEHVRANGVIQRLSAQDLIMLKQRGVSDSVINAMQQAPLVTATPTVRAIEPYPVIVREPYCPPPPVYYIGPRWGRHHHHCPPGVSWEFNF